MPHRIPHFLDSIAGFAASLLATASSVLITQTTTEAFEASIETRLLLLPLIGGILCMGGAVFLNPNPETMRINVGRAFIGLFACVVTPQVIAMIHPGIKEVTMKPFMLLLIGGVAAGLFYIISRPLIQGLYGRSARLSETALDAAEKRYFSAPKDKQDPPP